MWRAVVAYLAGLLFFPGVGMAQTPSPDQSIVDIASASSCNPQGIDRGPAAYIRGMALVFAKAVCQPDRPDVRVVSEARHDPNTDAGKSDALNIFDSWFRRLGMPNETSGVDTLRHSYVLLLGLGLVESSGNYCTGRDKSQNFDTADSAESGLFQTSWGARVHSYTLEPMFGSYRPIPRGNRDPKRCMIGVFSRHVSCSSWDAKNWGDPNSDGYAWQAVTKQCPAFSTEYAAVVLRTHGGHGSSYGEFGPINCYAGNKKCRKPSIYPACDAMFQKVQAYVQEHPSVCAAFQ